MVGNRRRQVIDKRSDMKVVAVCDQNLGGDGVFEDAVKFFAEFGPLLDEQLDVLFVCLTNDLDPDVTIAGLERGPHVFCEKPPGRDIRDVTRVIACHRKFLNLMLEYGFNHRYHDSVLGALRLVHSGELGKVINLRGLYGKA